MKTLLRTLHSQSGIHIKFLFYGVFCLASIFINFSLFKDLLKLSINNAYSTHIPLIPVLSLILIYRGRSSIIQRNSRYCVFGSLFIIFGILLACPWFSTDLSLRASGIVLIWIGGFLLIFGAESFRRALFPLLFLLLMIPIPDPILQFIISALQKGSAEASAILFKATGTAFYRDGLLFQLPGINIEIAKECSSIRSSLALLISSLLASHLLLKNIWCKTAFVLFAVPMAMLKNAIRIVVLSLLAVHVDTRWLTDSQLHSEGGVVFFILALLLMLPLLLLLRRSENPPKNRHTESVEKSPVYEL